MKGIGEQCNPAEKAMGAVETEHQNRGALKNLLRVALTLSVLSLLTGPSQSQTNRASDGESDPSGPFSEKAAFTRYAERLRESAIHALEPQVVIPTLSRSNFRSSSRYPWHRGIVTTVFWVGESATVNNPVHNRSSSWDSNWMISFGGYDNPDPAKRRGYFPPNFIPKQNPFYCALPYNDLAKRSHKPEAKLVIPWFKEAFTRDGVSVCRDRWVAISNRSGRTCYAQWSDCGPFRTDHYQYVFGKERPSPNLNKGAGLDISPAVRDYLSLGSTDVTDWQFVDFEEVPRGEWSKYGDNNDFVRLEKRLPSRVVASDVPRVITR
jgi:hypothetical protein